MKKIIKLTESDLTRIVKKVVNESSRKKLPDGVSLDDIKQHLNDENFLNKFRRHKDRIKRIIEGVYLEGKTIKSLSDELGLHYDEARSIRDLFFMRLLELRKKTENTQQTETLRKELRRVIRDYSTPIPSNQIKNILQELGEYADYIKTLY
jgi:hypothetical protein